MSEPKTSGAEGEVVVVGSANMDATVRVDRLPDAGETVLGNDLVWAPGGKGANQAVAATRMGATAALVARVGDDATGTDLRATLAGEGVDVNHVVVSAGVPTGVALITVDANGDNTIVVAPLANSELSVADVEAAASTIAGANVLVCQLETPLPTVVGTLELARTAGVATMLNASPAQAVDASVLGLVDVLVVNQHEAETLRDVLHPVPCRALIVTLGAAGAVVVEDGRRTELASHPVTALDTTGAGDAFCGALAAGIAAGQGVTEAASTAVAAGALAVTCVGAIPSLPTAAEVAELLADAPR